VHGQPCAAIAWWTGVHFLDSQSITWKVCEELTSNFQEKYIIRRTPLQNFVAKNSFKIVMVLYATTTQLYHVTKRASAVFYLNNKEAKRELKINFDNETLLFCSKPEYLEVMLDRMLTLSYTSCHFAKS